MKSRSVASAPAKVILFGEHFVVYDKPAIVIAIDKRAYVTVKPRSDDKIVIKSATIGASGAFSISGEYWPIEGERKNEAKFKPIYSIAKNLLCLSDEKTGLNIEINSSIPIAAGLGSSAAVAVASAAAIGSLLEINLAKKDIFNLALEAEKIVHRNPSGVDPAISTYGGALLYRKSEGIIRLNIESGLPLIVGNTGIERVTGDMVSHVSRLRNRYPSIVDRIMEAGSAIAYLGVEALKSGDLKTLGDLMNMNHALLCALGVSNHAIEQLIAAARSSGALGAKLTGAGGGGCIIALSEPNSIHRIVEAIKHAGGGAFATSKASEGVRIEE